MKVETQLMMLALEKGIEYIDKGSGHIQLKGPLLVNYYPNTKQKTAYVAGTTAGIKNVSPEDAVKMCFEAPKAPPKNKRAKRQCGASRGRRKRLLAKGITKCFWCSTPLTLNSSTIEHKIPLALGGLDNANNRTLACEPCNSARGSEMPELKAAPQQDKII